MQEGGIHSYREKVRGTDLYREREGGRHIQGGGHTLIQL